MKPYAFGVDIGGTTVKIGLFKTDGELLEKWEIPTRTEEEGRHILPDIAEAVKGKTAERKISPEEIEGITYSADCYVKEAKEAAEEQQ